MTYDFSIDGAFGARRAAGEHYYDDCITAANIYDELSEHALYREVRLLRNCWRVIFFYFFPRLF
jgi:hypothetical protein